MSLIRAPYTIRKTRGDPFDLAAIFGILEIDVFQCQLQVCGWKITRCLQGKRLKRIWHISNKPRAVYICVRLTDIILTLRVRHYTKECVAHTLESVMRESNYDVIILIYMRCNQLLCDLFSLLIYYTQTKEVWYCKCQVLNLTCAIEIPNSVNFSAE